MTNRDLIYLSIEYIENHLKQAITVAQVSKEIGFSNFYFSKLFKAITGISPKTYMTHRKISESYKRLINTEDKIVDIGLDYGFSNHESYSRAFQTIVGELPSSVRHRTSPNFVMNPLTKSQIENRGFIKTYEPELITVAKKYLVGLSFYYDLSHKNDLSVQWGNLMACLDQVNHIISPKRFYQLQYWFPNQEEGTMYFFLAVEVSQVDVLPIQLTAKLLPEMTCLKFKHKGLSNEVGKTYDFIYEDWLLGTDYQLPYAFNYEYYGDEYIGPYDSESISEIYIPVDLPK